LQRFFAAREESAQQAVVFDRARRYVSAGAKLRGARQTAGPPPVKPGSATLIPSTAQRRKIA